jgi:outer membrane lipase/esterase
VFTFTAVLAHAQQYTSIVIFGDSLSDTGNVADLTAAKYDGLRIPGPAGDYTDGRFTDGDDTVPAAKKYFGVWIEQLAAMLPSKPIIGNSLAGGNDYAYGFATTGSGTGVFTFGPSDSLSVNVNNIGQQITDYLATSPTISERTLFVVWGGAIDVLYATSSDDVIQAGINQAINIQRLIDAGATQFIIPNLPPLGLVPRLNGSPITSIPATKGGGKFFHRKSGVA